MVTARVASDSPPGAASAISCELEDLFARAVAGVGGLVERSYCVAGRPLRIRYAGEAMLDRIGPALAHLERQNRVDPLLVIDVWDCASTRAPAPPLPRLGPSSVPGAKYYSTDGRVKVLHQPASGVLNVLDASQARAWYWSEDPAQMPDWEAAASIRQILHWWLPDYGVVELHGGAVGTESGGVLLVGRGGSGKSTTCLSSVGHPTLRYAADDYSGVGVDPEPWAFSLFSSGKLEPGHAKCLPQLASAVANGERLHLEEKAVFYVHECFPESVIEGFPLKAVLVPRIAGTRETRIVPASPATALAALAPSTIFQLHPSTADGWRTMAELVRRIPSYTLELGSDIARIPEAILRFLESESRR